MTDLAKQDVEKEEGVAILQAPALLNMSTTDLVKLINDEYEVIQAAEVEVGNKILKRARQVAYKLAVLREKSKILGQ
jgi:hypothetical protein